MGATLESLLALQEIELQIVDIKRQLAAKERSVKRQTAKLRAAEEALETEREELKRTQMQMDEIDLDLKGRNASISRLRDNLNTVKTNKEYAAVLSQLNTEKADATRLETRVYELLETVEAKKATLAEHENDVQPELHRLTDVKAQFEQSRGSFHERLAALKRQREEASAGLGGRILELFNRISDRHEGEVMARVIQPYPRRQEFMCDGCNMQLTAEIANALLTRDDVLTCHSCGRVLYINKGG